jgi:peptidoglycan/LPS O-acetylase OafA/YrhL
MTHLVMALFGSAEVLGNFGLWAFLSVGAVALFGIFIPVVHWIDSRQKEREAFYKSETIRRVAEASGDGAKAAVELLREQSRLERMKQREGMKIGGLVTLGVGVALMIFLRAVSHGTDSGYFVGLIPALIGVALLVYVYFLSSPVE